MYPAALDMKAMVFLVATTVMAAGYI
jgi:hypothetical protein